MKAVYANFSSGKDTWDRFKDRILRRGGLSHNLSLHYADVPEPVIPAPNWMKIRTIMSGVSELDEGMFLHGDLSALGPYLSVPFVPGNENLGLVTDVGSGVHGIEPGERVVVDPLLSCRPRGIQPLCPQCSRGNPSACRNFALGVPGPGILVGACRDTGGGWGDFFLAHRSQVRTVPHHLDSDQAVLIPEFARALRAVLQHPPSPGERVVVVGARSLGILTLLAFHMLDLKPRVLVLAEQPVGVDLVRSLAGQCAVVLLGDPAEAAEHVAAFVGATVRYADVSRLTLEGGADLVYETTGTRDNVNSALRFAGPGKKAVLMGIGQASGFDLNPLWFKDVEIRGSAFSGLDSYNGEARDTMDLAVDMVSSHGLPAKELITHRFRLEDHTSALAVLQERSTGNAAKVIFQNVM